jgi:ribosomal-protein-alanine N-acetyltransferase
MPELQRVQADHEQAILAFETANRGYFTRSISDRGDDFFEHFAERHRELLDRQNAGEGAFYVLVADDGSILGRFNLTFAGDGVAELGYRLAEQATGRGVATATVIDLCRIAASQHGVRIVRAATSHANVASRAVLLKAGFEPVAPADPSEIGGKEGMWFERALDTQDRRSDRGEHG